MDKIIDRDRRRPSAGQAGRAPVAPWRAAAGPRATTGIAAWPAGACLLMTVMLSITLWGLIVVAVGSVTRITG